MSKIMNNSIIVKSICIEDQPNLAIFYEKLSTTRKKTGRMVIGVVDKKDCIHMDDVWTLTDGTVLSENSDGETYWQMGSIG